MKAKKVKGKDSKRWQKAVIGILLVLMMVSVLSLLTYATFGSDVTPTTVVRNGYIVNPDNVTISIDAEKTSVVELEKVRIIVTGAYNHNITISSSDPAHTIFPAGLGDNLPYDTSGFNDTIDEDGQMRYAIYFNDTGVYTIIVTDTTAGLDDSVELSVSEKAVTFDVPTTVVIGEKFTIKDTANTGTTVDIAVEDYVHPQLNDFVIDENGEFSKEIDTATANITPFTVPGSVRLKAYIDRAAGAGAIGPTETDDGSVAILMLEAHLNATLSKAIIPLGESFEVYGNASSIYVEIVATSPKGGNGIGMDGLYGVSIYTVPTFNPYMSGSSFYKLETGSDDIIIVTPFPIEPAYIKLDPIKDMAIGDDLAVTGTTNHIDGSPIVITVKGSMELPLQTAYVENGTFKAVFDTSYALPGVYTVKADDGDGHTDEKTANILSVMRNFYKKIKVDTGADTGNYTTLVLSPGIDGVYGSSSYKYIDSILDLDGTGPELGAIDVSNMTKEEIVSIIKNVTIDQAGSDDLLWEGHLIVYQPIYVDDDFEDDPANHRWNTIQEGINDAEDGDTVYVYNGTYYENLVVNKTITLQGGDRNTTIIDGGGSVNVVHVTADNCVLSGFTVQNNSGFTYHAGIKICSSNNEISNNIITNDTASHNWVGIWLFSANNNTLADNIINSKIEPFILNTGIVLYKSNNNMLRTKPLRGNSERFSSHRGSSNRPI